MEENVYPLENCEENVYEWKSYEDFKLLLDKVLETECGSSSDKHSGLTSMLNEVIKLKDIPCLQLLMEKAPYLPEEKDNNGQTPLLNVLNTFDREVNSDLLTIAQVLLQTNPKAAAIADNHGVTPLHHVVGTVYKYYGMFSCDTKKDKIFEFAKLLLENGADVNAEDEKHHTPLISAIKQDDKESLEMVKFLVSHGAKLYSESGYNVLCTATDSVQIMSYLLQQDSSAINLPDASRSTPLYKLFSSSSRDDGTMINLLFSHGLDVSTDTECIMVASKNKCCIEIIETLIAHGASFDSYTNDQRESVLQEYCTSSENVRKMLKLKMHPPDMNWTNLLIKVVNNCRTKCLEAVKLLVAAGADPTLVTNDGNSLLNRVCTLFIETHRQNLIPVIEFLCSLPKYTDTNAKFQFSGDYDPQITILAHFYALRREDSVRIMKSLLKTNFIAPERSVPSALVFSLLLANVFEPGQLTMLGSILNSEDIRFVLDDDTKNLMQLMFDAGLKFPDAECDQVTTALTALLAVQLPATDDLYLQDDEDSEQMEVTNSNAEEPNPGGSQSQGAHGDSMETEENSSQQLRGFGNFNQKEIPTDRKKVKQLMELAKQFIEAGVNVESMTLELLNTSSSCSSIASYHRDILRYEMAIDHFVKGMGIIRKSITDVRMEFRSWAQPLKEKLWLPDALWVSFLSGNGPAVKMLLPYWSAPPLALLVFMPPHSLARDLLSWYQVLSEYGGIPHGTEVYKQLVSSIEELMKPTEYYVSNLEVIKTVWTSFQELHSSPLSLCALSKYAVRAAYAERASKSDTSLPRIMAALSPPGLLAMLTQQV